jgi:hypothetical protein
VRHRAGATKKPVAAPAPQPQTKETSTTRAPTGAGADEHPAAARASAVRVDGVRGLCLGASQNANDYTPLVAATRGRNTGAGDGGEDEDSPRGRGDGNALPDIMKDVQVRIKSRVCAQTELGFVDQATPFYYTMHSTSVPSSRATSTGRPGRSWGGRGRSG